MTEANIRVVLQADFAFPDLPNEKQFQQWVDTVFTHSNNKIPNFVNEVCIRIVDKNESARLNETYRHKPGATNVLSFSNTPEAGLQDESLGDIAICAELVAEEAKEQGIPIQHHWAHLAVHGILHLLGYNHTEEQDAIIMEGLEIQILHDLDIPNPYKGST